MGGGRGEQGAVCRRPRACYNRIAAAALKKWLFHVTRPVQLGDRWFCR